MPMPDTSVIEIDLSAVSRNLAVLRQIVGPHCAICPIVKADAYGFGAVRIARCLVQGAAGTGADMLAVYTPRQAAELIGAGIPGPLLVLMPVRGIGRADELYRALVCGRLHLAVHDLGHVEDLRRLAEHFGVTIPLHLEIDTGMSRGGCNLVDAPAVLSRIAESHRLLLAGLYTHFSSAETDLARTDAQLVALERLIADCQTLIPPTTLVHTANSAATLRGRRYHKSMVRIGQAWAGYWPRQTMRASPIVPQAAELRPVLTWTSRLVHVKTIEAGACVGYGAAWRAPRRSIIGLVPVGYADGYPLALGSPAGDRPRAAVGVMVNEPGGAVRRFAPVVGAVNMDQITIDLTGIGPGAVSRVGVDTAVELISPDAAAPNHLPTLAAAAGTSLYELLCRLSPRIRREYRSDAPLVEVFPERATAAAAG